jgi:hypothetical protein
MNLRVLAPHRYDFLHMIPAVRPIGLSQKAIVFVIHIPCFHRSHVTKS